VHPPPHAEFGTRSKPSRPQSWWQNVSMHVVRVIKINHAVDPRSRNSRAFPSHGGGSRIHLCSGRAPGLLQIPTRKGRVGPALKRLEISRMRAESDSPRVLRGSRCERPSPRVLEPGARSHPAGRGGRGPRAATTRWACRRGAARDHPRSVDSGAAAERASPRGVPGWPASESSSEKGGCPPRGVGALRCFLPANASVLREH